MSASIDDSQVYSSMFDAHASTITPSGSKLMNQDDFLRAIAADKDFFRVPKERYLILFKLADRSKKGSLTKDDFVAFGDLLSKPDAEFEVAFRLFDEDGDGRITVKQFKNILSSNVGHDAVPINFNSEWMRLYIGSKSDRAVLKFDEFTQLLKGFQSERLQQEFKHYDQKSTGFITPEELKTIMVHLARHKLSPNVIAQIPTLANIYASPETPEKISFANARALFNVIRQMDTIQRIIAKSEFMATASRLVRFNTLTPMEVDTVFHLASGGKDSGKRLSPSDFSNLFDPRWDAAAASSSSAPAKPAGLPVHLEILKSAYNFALGSVAGAIGATFVYPIDLVKTRMQNQRAKVVGELLYKNSADCFRKVIRNEGVKGLYSGLLPQLLGVAPEKAIKLTMNDLVRSKLKDQSTGKVPLYGEILAGCVAGGSQVIFTNPLEIVKIRLQVQGEAAKSAEGAPRRSALWIVRNLGLVGLYKGAGACLVDLFNEGKNGKKLSILELLSAGALAGMPAAYLVTPADVIKTRLQVAARKGRCGQNLSCCTCVRSSPQFGVTLAAYEFLHTALPFSFDAPAAAPVEAAAGREESRRVGALRVVLDLSPDVFKSK
ncbi:mitochondrial carrier domain-containing protein [Chytridium lagenaria]|nr:mitochondrial carrier domain-containing protein [Chytridium lagenaria]